MGLLAKKLVVLEIDSGSLFVELLLALLKNEVVCAPLSLKLGGLDRAQALNILQPDFIIRATTENQYSVEENLQAQADSRIFEFCPNGGFIRFTSGTTGEAKGVLISSESALERIEACESLFSLTKEDTVGTFMDLPFHFISSLFCFLKNAATILIPSSSTPETVLKELEQHSVSLLYGAPFHYESLTCASFNRSLRLKHAISTSCALKSSTKTLFSQKFGIKIKQSLGIIEVGLPIGEIEKTTRSNSLGYPLANYKIKQVKKDGQSNLLAVSGPGMFDAYLEPFREATEVLEDGWFVCGDIVEIAADTGEVFLLGRAGSAINLAGHKIFPEEIEAVLEQFSGVEAARVYSEPHEITGQIIIADIVGKKELEEGDIRKYCQKSLGRIKTPKKFYFKTALQTTGSGKLKRQTEKRLACATLWRSIK